MWDEDGGEYIDFLSACGSLNYGHNHPRLKAPVLDYLLNDGIVNSLDLHTSAKQEFIRKFRKVVLEPHDLDYRLQFTGPTGANAVEAALKLARKATGRRMVAAFTNAFHGMTLGALAVSEKSGARQDVGGALDEVVRLPFEGHRGAGIAELDRFEAMALDPSSGVEPPAAFIVEPVQGEGGLNVASEKWLRRLSAVASALDSLLIVDDIQAGCGRTGRFFSFESAGIKPDIVCLAKSLSGIGLPMALVLLKPECDVWSPGEHNGTFRGNSLAFVSAAAALELWTEPAFIESISVLTRIIHEKVREIVEDSTSVSLRMKGLGMMAGIEFPSGALAARVADGAFGRGLLIETAGPNDQVLKIMPPLTIEANVLDEGLRRLREVVRTVLNSVDADISARAA
jgi:diaminobutyrate-2-oxoglutarate transaminase